MAEAQTPTSSMTTVKVSIRDEAYQKACSIDVLKNLETEVDTRYNTMKTAFEQMGDEINLGKITVFGEGKTIAQNEEAFITVHSELAGYKDALAERNALKAHKQEILSERERGIEQAPVASTVRPIQNIGTPEWEREGSLYLRNQDGSVRPAAYNSEIFWKSVEDKYGIKDPKELVSMANSRNGVEFELTGDYGAAVLNTLFQRSAGWSPEVIRERGWVDANPQRPIQLLDIIPSRPTTQSGVKFMQEKTFVNSTDGVAEAAAITESQFALEEKEVSIKKYGTLLPVTEEQVEDVDEVNSYFNQRIPFAVRQKVDEATLGADGMSNRITGFYHVTGVQSQALTVGNDAGKTPTQPFKDVFRGITLCRVNGRTRPTHAVLHPQMWEQIVLAELDANGYFFGNPQEGYMPRVWGLPVVENDVETYVKGKTVGMVGDFPMYSVIRVKRDLTVVVGLNDTDFAKDQMTYKATVRFCLVVYRPKAFVKFTRAG